MRQWMSEPSTATMEMHERPLKASRVRITPLLRVLVQVRRGSRCILARRPRQDAFMSSTWDEIGPGTEVSSKAPRVCGPMSFATGYFEPSVPRASTCRSARWRTVLSISPVRLLRY